MRQIIKSLTGLSAEAERLAKWLHRLVKRYSEDDIQPDDRIFNRILTNDWRHAIGGVHGPFNSRYHEAAAWVESFDDYVRQLKEYFAYVLKQPEQLSNLPISGRKRLPAVEIIRLLRLQRDVLNDQDRASGGRQSTRSETDAQQLRSDLQAREKVLGVQELAHRIGCNRDTLSDFLLGKTRPREKTIRKFRSALKAE